MVYFFCFVYRTADDVHDLMDDITDQQEVADEITTALSSGIGVGQEIDEVTVNV